jgi:predicted outer membrane protein
MFNYFSYSPISNLKYLVATLAILIQVLNSNFCTCVDYAAGVASIEAGLFALRSSSVEGNDVFVRASEIFSYIWRMQKDDQELKKQIPTLLIKSRLSASLLYDSLWKWRQYHIKAQTLDKTSKESVGKFCWADIS